MFAVNGIIFVESYEDLKPGAVIDVITDYEQGKKIEEIIDKVMWELLVKEAPFE